MANETARFSIDIESNAASVGDASAKSLLALKDSIQGSQTKIREMNSNLKLLRGSTDEVAAAKKTLKAKIDAEKDAISASSLAIIKQGTSVEALTKKERELSATVKKNEGSQKGLKEALSKSLNELKLTHPAMAAVASGALVAAAAVAALGLALTAGAVSLGKWIIESANLLRSENLAREVMLNNATNAANLGEHIQILAGKVSTARSKLNEFAVELSRTRISGNALVDTLNAMGQASGAGLDDLASKLKDIATRGQLVGRMQLSPQELLGSGLEFKEVAEALASSMKIGVDKAKKALFEGRVKIDDGAKALKLAVEKRFGEINLRKMLDLNVMAAKFKEGMQALTKDVKLEPLLKAIEGIGAAFSQNTVTGQTLKMLFESLAEGITKTFVRAAPYITAFFQGMILGALETGILFYKVRNAIRDAFGGKSLGDMITFERTAMLGKYAVFALVGSIAALGVAIAGSIALIAGPYVAAFAGIVFVFDKIKDAFNFFRNTTIEEWKGLGGAIIDGLIAGITNAWSALKSKISDLGSSISKTFRGVLKIESPSKVFESDGRNIVRGVGVGIDKEKPSAESKAGGMLDNVQKKAGGSSAGGSVVVNVTINGGGSDKSDMRSPAFLESLKEAITNALLDAGVSV